MSAILCRRAAIATAAVLLLGAGRASAQINTILYPAVPNGNASVQAYFASQGDLYHQSDPAGLPTWGVAGSGPYGGTSVPGVPLTPAYPDPVYSNTLTPANYFVPSPYTSSFNDGGSPATTATSTISANAPGGAAVADANVQVNMSLNEPLIPPGYAYEQIDFALDYGTINSLTGGISGAPSFLVSGSTSGLGSYAQLGGQINYWWQSSNTTYSVINAASAWTYLGSLDYNWSGTGTFSVTVSPTGTLAAAGAPSTIGVLEVTGDIFVAGDPATINVESVPEPSSWLLFGIGLVAFGVWPLLRRRATTV
jgi:hypothetical protein